ncbi:MAG: TonB-dependent receptor [Bacteroidales bacterium]|nr:TonB-dependent receptor [Bacteroidales bacterium]
MKKLILLLCLALVGLCSYAQNTVKGVVASATDNEPLIGATVQIKGSGTGTITDFDGNYSLTNVPADGVLVFSSVGYESQEIKIAGRSVINVMMKDVSELLDEVVVIGYGVVKKSDLTSSIATVKGEEITEIVTGNAMSALQGKINGVQVTSAGGPGAQPKVLIRGVTTVNNTDPLYVVDGMPVGGNINFLNSNDIESMEVLKDASAAAIYGTRASNGVILITTKKGIAGKTNINFSTSVGFQTLSKPKMADITEYKDVFNARYLNDGSTSNWNDTGATTNPGGTDWWDEVINKTALIQNYSFNVSGGTDKLLFSFSLGYFRNDSQYDYGYWDKINARLNVDYTFNKYVKIGIDVSPRVESWDDTPNLFSAAMSMDPTTPILKPQDQWVDNEFNNYQRSYNNQEWNPAGSLARMNNHSRDMGAIMNSYVQVNPIEKLTLRTQFGANAHFRRTDKYTPKFYIDALEQSTLSNVSREMREWLDWNWTNTATYVDTFAEKHNINLMGGFTAERFAEFYTRGERDDVPSNIESLQEVDAGRQNQKGNGNTYYNTLVSYLGRVMYNYDNRYYLTASIRADGSSRFPKENKYAFFPSVSASWRIISESFMEDQKIFNNLKLRGGWGRVGNQGIDNNATLTLLNQADYVFGSTPGRVPGSMVSSVGNNQLKWETVEDWNVGVDMSFLNSRLDMTFEYFQKKSIDMLYRKQNIFAIGYPDWNSTVWMNIGSMKASGWELSLNWSDKVSDFRYNIGLNLSAVRNKAVKFSGDGPIQTGGFHSDQIIRNEDGGLISRFYGFLADGVFQNWTEIYAHTNENGKLIQDKAVPGDIRFKDLNHDGVLDENDKTWIGNPYPDLMMGLNLGLNYKSFDFTANFYGTFGNDIFNKTKSLYSGVNGQNVWAGTLEKTWHGEGTSNDIPRLSYNDLNQNYTRVSSFFVEDGSYMRCKLLQVGYTLPKKIVGGMELRFSFSAQNPFTITGYSGMDPERPQMGSVIETGIDGIAYPNPRTFLFGIDFKF